ncbi:hypothetical protein [Pseudofrankia inefficax]|uniref:ATP/GTP-binding protein n=1 Tax=Pseudofrankia inefficax (strain DSM 45817 / CECT 9037 / DDB 130130 / EuI1c) TaxID=298654 RepID=E3IXL0_PSEI1|nr:hypothetical protein [Pseudofrankia inefficax]ADP79027.1 hypothetical protein FraEuI1c_0954 [Pseudofrankia inefficax]
MSPRRGGSAGRPRKDRHREDEQESRPGWLVESVVINGEDWSQRPVTGAASGKSYRCPGCDHEISPGVPHMVVWPSGRTDSRRHWHTPCWARRRAGGRPYRAPY